ncbi:small secreted hydrophilic protein [Streptomyces sp. NPDC004838]
MVFSHRIAALAAVVAIPLGIAVTSYALTDSPDSPKVVPKVQLETGSSAGPSGSTGTPSGTLSPSSAAPTDETVAPPVSENSPGDDDGTGPGTGPGGGTGASPSGSGTGGLDDDGPGGDDYGDDG